MQHFYESVPKIGNVAVSRHAQANVLEQKITERDFELALFDPNKTVREGFNTLWLERGGIRLVVVLRPEPFSGAALVTTAFRMQQNRTVEKI
jgi:hypothetical protein